jgi:hypothetical protein
MLAAWSTIARWQRMLIGAWCAWLVVPAVVAYVLLSGPQRKSRLDSARRHVERMDVTKNDAVHTEIDTTRPPGHESDVPTVVTVGVYLARIPDFSIVGSSWTADFYVWFKWDDERVTPGETFKIVNGEIVSRTLMTKIDKDAHHYAIYRVLAHMTKSFDTARFPRDDHLLTIALEDQGLPAYSMVYVADAVTSEMSSRVEIPGYAILPAEIVAKLHTYKTSMGNPSFPPMSKITYAELVFGIPIARPSWGLFFKMFVAMYVAIALGLAALFVRGPAERLGLTSTALFLAVMNGMEITSLTPDTGIATLSDVINGIGYFTIGQMIIQSVIYYRYFSDPEKDRDVARIFDRVSVAVLTAMILLLNVGVLAAASE